MIIVPFTVAFFLDILRTIDQSLLPCAVQEVAGIISLPSWVYAFYIRSFIIFYNAELHTAFVRASNDPTHLSRGTRFVLFIHRHQWLVKTPFLFAVYLSTLLLNMMVGFIVVYLDPHMSEVPCFHSSFFWIVLTQVLLAATLNGLYFLLLWKVRDAYLIRLEFALLSIFSFPWFVVWAFAFEYGWTGSTYNGMWVTAAHVTMFAITVLIPLIGSYQYEKLMKRTHSAESAATGTGSESRIHHDDEFLIILRHPVFLAKFERFALLTFCCFALCCPLSDELFPSSFDPTITTNHQLRGNVLVCRECHLLQVSGAIPGGRPGDDQGTREENLPGVHRRGLLLRAEPRHEHAGANSGGD